MLTLLELVQGEDAHFDVPVLVDGALPASPIDDWSFAWRLFAARDDADSAALVTLTSASGHIIVRDSAACTLRLRLPAAPLSALAAGKYYFRLTAEQTGGDDAVLARGTVKLSR